MTNPWTIASSTRFFFTRSAILRRQPSPCSGVATMSAAGEKNFNSDAAHLETIFKQKKALRSVVKRDLKSMDPILRSQEDEAIQRIVMEAPWFKACKRLCAYISCSALREVDTTQIMFHIFGSHPEDLQMQKKLFVPRVEDRNRNMRMLNISSTEDLISNSMDILEPAPVDADGNDREDVLLANEPVDLFLLPGLAFDKAGRRLGRGGGYYDTFLSRYEELAKERNWKQPLKSMSLCLLLSRIMYHFAVASWFTVSEFSFSIVTFSLWIAVALCYSVQIVDEGTIPLTPNDILVDALVSPSGVIPIRPAALEIRH